MASRDRTATSAEDIAPNDESGIVVAEAMPTPNADALELPPLTLTVTDDVVAGGVGAAILAPWPN